MSSPANNSVEVDAFTGTRLQDVLAADMRQVVMRHLLEEGEASIEELTTVTSATLATGTPTDHERVRTAVSLQIDHLPVLADTDLVTIDDDTVAVAFLPTDTIRELRHVLE